MKKIFFFILLACLILFFYLIDFHSLPTVHTKTNVKNQNIPTAEHLKTLFASNEDQAVVLCRETSSRHLVTIQKNILPFFKRDGSRQCDEEKGSSPKEMGKILTNMGIPIVKFTKGYLAKSRGPALCGEPTNNINIFYIANILKNEQIDALLKKGFKSCVK